jgi:hypothetical protein
LVVGLVEVSKLERGERHAVDTWCWLVLSLVQLVSCVDIGDSSCQVRGLSVVVLSGIANNFESELLQIERFKSEHVRLVNLALDAGPDVLVADVQTHLERVGQVHHSDCIQDEALCLV